MSTSTYNLTQRTCQESGNKNSLKAHLRAEQIHCLGSAFYIEAYIKFDQLFEVEKKRFGLLSQSRNGYDLSLLFFTRIL